MLCLPNASLTLVFVPQFPELLCIVALHFSFAISTWKKKNLAG